MIKLAKTISLKSIPVKVAIPLMLAVGWSPIQTLMALETESAYTAISANDPAISPDQLHWLVKPLTMEELIIEANAWRDLLKDAVRKISASEIEVLRRNIQIKKSEEAATASRASQESVAESEALTRKASKDMSPRADQKAAEVIQKARTQAAIEAVKNSEAEDEVFRTAQQVVEEVQADAAHSGETATETASSKAANITVQDVETNALGVATNLESVALTAEINAEVTSEAKSELLETLTKLRTQRAGLVERFNVVLRELKLKGSDIEVYENYRKSVDEVIVDVSDTSAALTFIIGWLNSEKGGVKWALNASKFVIIMAIFYGLALMIGKLLEKANRNAKTMSQLQREFLNMFTRRAIIATGLLIAVSTIGIAVTPLLALITAAGLVIGLALQGTLSNFASGLLLLFYRPFDIGDAIDAGGTAGTVDSMNLMSTIIRTWDNKVTVVPNNNIWGNTITNISRTNRRRVDMVFGISYSDSIEKAQSILVKIAKEHPNTLDDPEPVVRVHELGDSSVNFIVRPWVRPADYWEVYWSITRKVKEEFDENAVSIPFPQRDLHLYQESKLAISTTEHSKEKVN